MSSVVIDQIESGPELDLEVIEPVLNQHNCSDSLDTSPINETTKSTLSMDGIVTTTAAATEDHGAPSLQDDNNCDHSAGRSICTEKVSSRREESPGSDTKEADKSHSITLPKVPENSVASVDVNHVRGDIDAYTPDHSSIRPSTTHSEGERSSVAHSSRAEQSKESLSPNTPPVPASPTSEGMKKDTNETIHTIATSEIEKPSDIRFLTIKNLDTGEEFVIGENDPDFEFDTFEIGGGPHAEGNGADDTFTTPGEDKHGTNGNNNAASKEEQHQQRKSWWRSFFNLIYGSKESKENLEIKIETATSDQVNQKSSSSSQKTPFTKLSSFKFRKELGRGAFGRVLLAEAKTDGKLYALKIISKKNMRSSDKRQAKAERDILYAMTLKAPHPFTSGLKFAFQSENNLYLGMDFIPGGNLRELIKKFKYLPEDWVKFYAAELILAISHLHSLNVLYRDIKPHNVMIDARGHLILIDFGLSKQEISHPRGALSLVGTPDYSAPEVLRTGVQQIEQHNREKAMRNQRNSKKKKATAATPGKKAPEQVYAPENKLAHIGYGKAADWWSLGIMIYEMLSGKPTFRGADLRETYQRILYSKLEFVPEDRFSPEAKILLEGLINRDPSLRLGAWENPPKDIMNSPFFDIIQWDAVYERRQDGPYIPELPSFMKKRKEYDQSPLNPSSVGEGSSPSSSFSATGTISGGDWKKIDFSPLPLDRMTIPDPKEEEQKKQTKGITNASTPGKKENTDDSNHDDNDDDHDDDDDSEDSEDESEEEEEIPMRDSVFVGSQAMANNQNQLPDWSFIDEAVLMSYITNAAQEGKEKQKKNKSKDKKSKKESSSKASSGDGKVEPGEVTVEKKMETIEEEKEDDEDGGLGVGGLALRDMPRVACDNEKPVVERISDENRDKLLQNSINDKPDIVTDSGEGQN